MQLGRLGVNAWSGWVCSAFITLCSPAVLGVWLSMDSICLNATVDGRRRTWMEMTAVFRSEGRIERKIPRCALHVLEKVHPSGGKLLCKGCTPCFVLLGVYCSFSWDMVLH